MRNGRASRICCPAKLGSLAPQRETTGCSSMRCSTATYRAGIPWRDLPERFGDFRLVHTRHSRWSGRGVWQRLFEFLAQDADNKYAMIDSTIVRAHQHSAGAKKGVCTRRRLGAAQAD
jgi:transposase